MPRIFGGQFLGTTLLQESGNVGGSRSVFVKMRGYNNDLVFPTHGGQLKNPFKGSARIFAGDLFEYRPNSNGEKPSLYLLKTYKVKSQSGTDVVIYKDGYKHVPFAGDILMIAPAKLGGTGTAVAVTSVSVNADGNWQLSFASSIGTVADGDILVEAEEAGTSKAMVVKNINAVAPCDYDCFYDPAASASDYEGARYHLAPAIAGTMYESKMSPLPACVKAVNICNVNGWFRVDALNNGGNVKAQVADHEARITALEP